MKNKYESSPEAHVGEPHASKRPVLEDVIYFCTVDMYFLWPGITLYEHVKVKPEQVFLALVLLEV